MSWPLSRLILALASGAAAAEPPLVRSAVALDGGRVHDEQARTGGSLDSDWQLAEARVFLRPHVALRLGLGVGVGRDAYHSDDLDLPAEIRHAWVRVPFALMLHPRWGFTVQGSLGTGYARDASASDGRQWQVQGGPLYHGGDDLVIALLVNISSRIDDDPTVFPFPSLYWRFHPAWRLTIVDEVDNLSHLRWAVGEEIDLGLRVDVRLREAALTRDTAFSDDHVAGALQVTWMPLGRDRWEITPFLGAQLVRRLAERDDDGAERWSLLTNPALMIGLHVRAGF
jgi:hypothetical protein